MKKLLAILALCVAGAAQGAILTIPGGAVTTTATVGGVTVTTPVANATVTWCTYQGSGTPCSPAATVYGNQSLTGTPTTNVGVTNAQGVPVYDGQQNIYAAAGTYVVTETGSGITPASFVETIGPQCNAGVSACAISALTIGTLTATSPAITPTTVEGVVYADQFAGAHSSTATTTGSASSGSASLTLANAEDFKNGDGIVVVGAGAAVTLGTPSSPSVTVTGSTNAATCTYSVAALDADLGETAASTATGATNCGATGTSTNGVITTFNTLSWTPVTGARGYVIYENPGTGYAVAGIVGIPATVQWWTSDTGYGLDQLIQPRGPQYNGWTYKVTTAGTSGGAQPDWCTTANCTVTDGTVTWTAQPFTWHDDGRNWAWYGLRPEIPTIPATPPVSAIADALVTTISSGAGTTAITLATTATTTVSDQYVAHDNTAAFNAAEAAQSAACLSGQTTPGSTFLGTCPTLVIPSGHYMISGALVNASSYASVMGTSDSIIEQINPVADIFDLASPTSGPQLGYLNRIEKVRMVGGWHQIFDGQNITSDSIVSSFDNDEFRDAHDYAFVVFDTSSASTLHMAAHFSLNHSRFMDNVGQVYEYCDRFYLNYDWFEFAGWVVSNDWDQPMIVNATYTGGMMYVDHSYGIPGFATPSGVVGGRPAGIRWIDDYWTVALADDRIGPEGGGGMPIVYYQGGFITTAGDVVPPAGGAVSFGTGEYYGGGSNPNGGATDASELFLANGAPTTMDFHANSQIGSNEPYIQSGQGAALLYNLWQKVAIPVGASQSALFGPLAAYSLNLGSGSASCTQTNARVSSAAGFPAELLGMVTSDQCRAAEAIPVTGIWVNGQFVRNYGLGNNAPSGWEVQRSGLAAPAWTADTAYAADTFVTASPDDQHVFAVTVACTSGSSQPTWNTTSGGTTTDNTCTWKENGQSALFAPIGPMMEPNGAIAITAPGFSGASTLGGNSLLVSADSGETSIKAYNTGPAPAAINAVNNNGGGACLYQLTNESGDVYGCIGVDGSGNFAIENRAGLPILSFSPTGTVALQMPLIGSVAGSTTALAANSCGDTATATVTGATTSMTASVSPSADPGAGLTWQAWVSAASTVSVRYCNVTAGSITPAAANLVIRVIQ